MRLILLLVLVASAALSAQAAELASSSAAGTTYRLDRAELPKKGDNECILFRLRAEKDGKSKVIWRACDLFSPKVFPRPEWSGAVGASQDGKTVVVVTGRAFPTNLQLALHLIGTENSRPIEDSTDEKGKLKNRRALEAIMRKPEHPLAKNFAAVGNCGLDLKVQSLDMTDAVVIVHVASEGKSAKGKECAESQFRFDLKSKKWIE